MPQFGEIETYASEQRVNAIVRLTSCRVPSDSSQSHYNLTPQSFSEVINETLSTRTPTEHFLHRFMRVLCVLLFLEDSMNWNEMMRDVSQTACDRKLPCHR